jgi:hypothetical protein
MRVLKDHDYRLPARQTFELPDQRLQCPLLLALRSEVRQRAALRTRQAQQIRQERHILIRRCGTSQHGLELLQPSFGRVLAREVRRPIELVNEREKSAVLVIGRAEITQVEMRLGAKAVVQCCGEPRLADAGLAGDQHDLTVACLGAGPPAQ